MVSISDADSGVRHRGQTPPDSCGTTTAAQEGQERMFDTCVREVII
jgi:hypothetical protein